MAAITTNSYLIPNLLDREISLKTLEDTLYYKKGKESGHTENKRWRSLSSVSTGNDFPSAFMSCDNIYSNKKKKIKESNTLFVENPPLDTEDATVLFRNEPGFLVLKQREYYGKNLCFITFKNIEMAKKSLEKFSKKSNWYGITFARNPTRDMN